MSEDYTAAIDTVTPSEKVVFLNNKGNYPDNPTKIDTIETHMSWVFLSDDFVYKLKKPVKYNSLDLRTLEARFHNCKEEVRLNKRLGGDIYIGLTPLVINNAGRLQLDGHGMKIDWLVKMKRLPAKRMLDYTIAHKVEHPRLLGRAATILSAFYKNSHPAETDVNKYRNRIKKELIANEEELLSPDYSLPKTEIRDITSRQLNFTDRYSSVFDKRIQDGKIIEAHGDLRPEHICLITKPVFIDCLEFNRELRILDVAEELSYLAMECEMLGAPHVGVLFLETYEKISGDNIPLALIDFFKSKRASLRAKFTIWHIKEAQYRQDTQWVARAKRYLHKAQQCAERLT